MQVSQIAELDTHAVIGGGKAHAFGMSDSAEFFTVLSDTLYRDKKRAVIREVVCNAWDAHIMGGCTDRPVEITLTDEELVIRDFGPGIADDRIVPIYCVYGASTKVKDDNQTGGFGLGSKAPFAYSDHFTVTSCHNGFRTVYAISRGGAATDGKPDIRAMVRVSTKETGITVSIPLRQPADRREFATIVRAVVLEGGMKGALNGEPMSTIDYSAAREKGFGVVPASLFLTNESRVYLLYGTVLYPISTTDVEIQNLVRKAAEIAPSGYRLILVAPPNSVGVTPSREALSYSERTTETIKSLLGAARKQIEHHVPRIARETVKARMPQKTRHYLNTGVDGLNAQQTLPTSIVSDPHIIARLAVNNSFSTFVTGDHRLRLVLQEAAKQFRDDRRTFRRAAGAAAALKSSYYRSAYSAEKDTFRHSSRLVLRMASKLGLLNNLVVVASERYSDQFFVRALDTVSAGEVIPRIIVAPSQKAAIAALKEQKGLLPKSNYDKAICLMALILKRPADHLLAAIKTEASRFNLAVTQLDFPQPKRRQAVSTKLFHSLSEVKSKYGPVKLPESPTLEMAPIYVRATGTFESVRMNQGVLALCNEILNLYPDVAIALNAKQEAKLKAMGAVDLMSKLKADLAKLNATRDVQYAYAIAHRLFIEKGMYGYHHGVSQSAVDLARMNSGLAQILFPPGFKLNPAKVAMAEKLVMITTELGSNMTRIDRRIAVGDVMGDLDDKTRETFASKVLSEEDAKKHFAYLWPLKSSHNYTASEARQLGTLIKYLQRQQSKSALNDDNQKEAA